MIQGDAKTELLKMPDESVHVVVTSPPYWGLRDYGVDGQLGLEGSPSEYVRNMVAVFHEVRRVLKREGTLWLNIGDSYAGSRKGGHNGYSSSTLNGSRQSHDESRKAQRQMTTASRRRDDHEIPRSDIEVAGLKPKDMVGIPWMLAFALRDDGWYLRQDIIWAKPSPMPESVNDRCTKAHEYLFLFSKSRRYYFDAKAIAEPVSGGAHDRGQGVNPKAVAGWATGDTQHSAAAHARPATPGNKSHRGATEYEPGDEHHRTKGGLVKFAAKVRASRSKQNPSFSAAITKPVEKRNKRSVWTIPAEPFSEAHFATFPRALVRPCILAGCPAGGTVLDPFAGSGTTLLVAESLNCKAIGIELNPEYIAIAKKRLLHGYFDFEVTP